MSRKLLFGVFAHPDDEAFGPSAYLYRQAQQGADVHLVLVTDGSGGHNNGFSDLAKIRHQEWLESGRRIGAKSSLALGYKDGCLCNNLYHEIADKIIDYAREIINDHQASSIQFVTMEPRGVTGHLDHISVSYITTYVYEALKQRRQKMPGAEFEKLLYFCLNDKIQQSENIDWLYMPPGIKNDQVHFTHDFSDIVDQKMHIMRAHQSQRKDLEAVILARSRNKKQGQLLNEEHFIIKH